MKEILDSLVEAMGEQTKAVGVMADQLAALKRTLERHHRELAEELKTQGEQEQEQNRTSLYDLQVSLARVREAIAELPDPTPAEQKKEAARARKKSKEGASETSEEASRAGKNGREEKGAQGEAPPRIEEQKASPKPDGK